MDELITTQENAVALDQLTSRILAGKQNAAINMLWLGHDLIEAKKLVFVNQWGNYLANRVDFTQQTANKMMKCWERFGKQTSTDYATSRNLSSSQMFELIALPPSAEEEFRVQKEAEGNPVENMTIKELRKEIANYKKTIAEQGETIAARDKTIDDNKKAYQESLFKLDEAHKKEVTDLKDELDDVQSELADKTDKLEDAKKELKERPTVTVPPEDYQQTKKDFAAAQIELGKAQAAIENQAKDFERQSKEAQAAFATERQEFQEKLDKAGKKITKLEKANERLTRKDYTPPTILTADDFKLICADIRGGLPDIADNSVDFIITDPPYPKKYLPLYGDLSKVAARVLKDGGSLICMTGQSYLPEVIQLLGTNMTYQWCLCYLTPGQKTQIWGRHTQTVWKPLLWFVKGGHKGDWLGADAVMMSDSMDKKFHEWGQSFSGMKGVIERFTDPDDVILDPFLGGGTTGIAALSCKRKFIGADIEPKNIETTQTRIMEEFNNANRTNNA